MLDPETLFFIDDQQSQVLEGHILRYQAMSADDDVQFPCPHVLQDQPLLLAGAESREHLHSDREGIQPLLKSQVVLLGQDGGRHQHRNLLSVHDRFESRPQGHLGLAVAYVTTDQTIHGLRSLHIRLHFIDSSGLILSFLIGKRGLQVCLPGRIGLECMTPNHLAGSVYLQQILGDILNSFPSPLPDL